MAKAFKGRILDLLPKLAAHTFRILGALASAGAVSAGSFQPLFHHFDDLLVQMERDFQEQCPPLFSLLSLL